MAQSAHLSFVTGYIMDLLKADHVPRDTWGKAILAPGA